MADFQLWGVIRELEGSPPLAITITALPEPLIGAPRVEVFYATTRAEAEAIRADALSAWGAEIVARGDRVIDVVDD